MGRVPEHLPSDTEVEKLKVREIRERFDREDAEEGRVELGYWMTPRSENTNIHSPTLQSDVREAMRNGERYVSGSTFDEVVWEADLDDEVRFLTGSQGQTSLLVKNVKVEVVVND